MMAHDFIRQLKDVLSGIPRTQFGISIPELRKYVSLLKKWQKAITKSC